MSPTPSPTQPETAGADGLAERDEVLQAISWLLITAEDEPDVTKRLSLRAVARLLGSSLSTPSQQGGTAERELVEALRSIVENVHPIDGSIAAPDWPRLQAARAALARAGVQP